MTHGHDSSHDELLERWVLDGPGAPSPAEAAPPRRNG